MKMKMYRVTLLSPSDNILPTIIGYFPHREDAERHIKYQLYDEFLYYFDSKKMQQIINNRYIIDELEYIDEFDIDFLYNLGSNKKQKRG